MALKAVALILAPMELVRRPARGDRRAWRGAEQAITLVHVFLPEKARQPPGHAAWGQRAGIVRIGWPAKAESPGLRSPERVWTLLALPPESLPAALTVKGAGGEGQQQGRRPMLVSSLSGLLLFRLAARQLCGLLIHEPPRSSWATRPQPSS